MIAGFEKLLRSAVTPTVQLETQLGTVPPVLADPVQIQQIVMNLVLNAAEAMGGRGVIRISIDVREIAPDTSEFTFLTGPVRCGRYISLLVEDRGPGMDEATLRRIGDPFFTTKASGHGLGLATVLGLVRGLGGALGVESVVGRGTRFLAAFPTVPIAREQAPLRSILSRPS